MKRQRANSKKRSTYKKVRTEIEEFVSSSHTTGHIGFSYGNAKRPNKHHAQQSRKEKRKEARKLKRAKRLAYHQRKPIPTQADVEKEKHEAVIKEREKDEKKKQKNKKKEKRRREAEQKRKKEEERQQELELLTRYDDKEIKDLEKKLFLNKRKTKTLPKSFMDDGLDYILDAVDAEKLESMAMEESGSDMEKDFSDNDEEGSEDQFGNPEDENAELNNSDDNLENELLGSESEPESDEGVSDSGFSGTSKDDNTKETWEKLADKIQEAVGKTKKKKSVGFSKEVIEKDEMEESLGGVKKKVKLLQGSEDDEFRDLDDEISDSEEQEEESDSAEDSDDNSDVANTVDDEFWDDELEDDSDIKIPKISGASQSQESGLKEDIYGRLRDAEGNIVKDNLGHKPGMYVPPAKRVQLAGTADAKKKAQLEKLQRQLKGLVNRASESNMQPVSSSIEQLYLSHSRADVNDSLVSVILDASVAPVLTPDRLAMEFMMLVAILHGNVGSEVGAAFLQNLVARFDGLLRSGHPGSDKSLDNVVVLLAHLYNFKVVHSTLIFDVMKMLIESFKEKDVEVILVLLRHVGFTLRKDDPAKLKEVIVQIQTKASTEEVKAVADQSRLRFMLDVIMAIKNNNMRKIPNYDPEHLDHLRKLIRSFIRGGRFGDNQLHISFQDLRNAEEKGKWWVVGSAWEGGDTQLLEKKAPMAASVIGGLEITNKLQELARKQRMNTDTRRNIFYIIMTSEDYMDAFEKLLRLGLKSSQQQEIIIVILDCCLQENKFNPFYAYLAQKFCEHHRSYHMSFQFSIWDRFKELGNLSESGRHNFGKLLTHLITSMAMSLSVFKVISFGTLEKPMVRLLKQVMTELLQDHPLSTTEAVFSRIASLNKLRALHEGLKLFLHHFLIGKKKDKVAIPEIVDRVALVDKLLSEKKGQMLL